MIDLSNVCGEKLAERIRARFGNELEGIIDNLELEKLIEVEGLGKKRALKILRAVYEEKTGVEFREVLLGDSEREHSKIIEKLQSYPVTKQAKNKFLLFYPTNNREFIEKRLELCEESGELLSKVENLKEILKNLKKINELEYPKKEKYKRYVILTDDEEIHDSLEGKHCDIMFISSPEETSYYRENYFGVIYLYSDNSELYEDIMGDVDTAVHIRSFDIEEVIPEIVLSKFLINKKKIEAAREIYAYLGIDSVLDEVVQKIETLDEEEEKEIDLDAIVLKAEREINSEIEEKVEEEDLSVHGKSLLGMMEDLKSSESPLDVVKRSMPTKVNEIYNESLKKHVDDVYEETGVSILDLFPPEITFPIEVDYDKLEDMKRSLERERFKEKYEKMKEAAEIGLYWGDVEKIIANLFEIDFKLALARFIDEYDLKKPQFVENGLSFENGRNMFLGNPVGVSYKLGETPHSFVGNEQVTVLTGANSGGKTTLLGTMLQIQILAQIGLYVPADKTYTTIFNEIQYLEKQKSGGAGALETALMNLISLSMETQKNLILIDELEAITEPGSAAKIIGEFLNILNENKDCFVVLVTHLGEDILKIANIRCDGIEASGLDDNLNLIVERQPIFNKMGRSTPELIVEKLSKKSKGKEKEIFEKVLKRLQE
ncbi:MAG: hypothetical protein U9N35_02940 [Euryarchaeota archaeon]|nr:hypothetical protein [Euryarchaeota archaeon]